MTQVRFGDYNMSRHNVWYHRSWVDDYLWKVTKSIIKDELWNGRFYVRRVNSKLVLFEDGSGGILYVTIRFYDKKTKTRWDKWTDALDMQSNMFLWMNEFICDHVKVWENESPYKERDERLVRKSLENFKNF